MPTWALKQEDFAHLTHKAPGHQAEGSARRKTQAAGFLSLAPGLPAPLSTLKLSCVSWGNYPPSLCLSLLLSKIEAWQGSFRVLGAGPGGPTRKARTQSALDKCRGNCCGRREGVKAGRFLIVK